MKNVSPRANVSAYTGGKQLEGQMKENGVLFYFLESVANISKQSPFILNV